MSQPPPPPPPGGPYPPQPPGGSYPGSGPQQPWPHQPPPGQWPAAPPPKRGNGWKWALGAVALLAVVGVTVAVTMSVSGEGDSAAPPSAPTNASGEQSEIASTDDTGSVAVITEDPTCAPVAPILETRAAAQRNGWNERDPSIPATAWTPEMRSQHETVGQAMRDTADELVPIAKMTPHRVMRALYEQLIAYSRAYAETIPNYTPRDNFLSEVTVFAANAISNICASIASGAAAARAPLVQVGQQPSEREPADDPARPNRFLITPNSVCPDWATNLAVFKRDIGSWLEISPDIPASQWTPEQRTVHQEVAPVMRRFSNQLQVLGERSGNPVLKDFAELAGQYYEAYVEALPTQVSADQYLAAAANIIVSLVDAACSAAES